MSLLPRTTLHGDSEHKDLLYGNGSVCAVLLEHLL
jgi:hypothetical protein